MNKYFISLLILIIGLLSACNSKPSEAVETDQPEEVISEKPVFKTDYPEGMAGFMAKNLGNTINEDVLIKEILVEKYTTEEVKFLISNMEYDKPPEIEMINDEILIACCKFLGEKDPKWMLRFYFETLMGVEMMADEGSEVELDESWLPSGVSWAILSPNDDKYHADYTLEDILYGWNRQKNFKMLEWCKLLEKKTLNSEFSSGVRSNAHLLKFKRQVVLLWRIKVFLSEMADNFHFIRQ